MTLKNYYKPTLSYVGLCLVTITAVAHLCFKLARTSDVGLSILLSLVNALCLVFTLLWGIMGIFELVKLLKLQMNNKRQFKNGSMHKDDYMNKSKRLYYCLFINVSYLVFFLCQLVYVIYNFDEVNV